MPRATWYDQKKRQEAEKKRRESDAALKAEIEAILREHPESGDHRLEAELRRRGMVVNGKRVRRLLHTFELSLTRKVRKPKPNPLLET
ncbi:IS3 family transposase, partial [Hydrogenibacillus schlegelii]|uniref:IS3 family transposase n=2 Tax=Hydrogenibacillus schlegelii TaxID=1484 RepID=UPI0039E810BA